MHTELMKSYRVNLNKLIKRKNGAGVNDLWYAGSEQKVVGDGYGSPTSIGTGSLNYKKKQFWTKL